MSQEIYLPPDLADALRRYFQVYHSVVSLLSSLCDQNSLAVYRALKYLGIEPWGVAPSASSGMAEAYFAFNECQFTLKVPSWALPKEVLEEPGINVYEEGEEPSYISLDTGTCIDFYLRGEGYEHKHGPQIYLLHRIILVLTENNMNSVIPYIVPAKFLFVFIFVDDRLILHKVMPPYKDMPITGAEEEVGVVIEVLKSYINCCKDELIQAVNCATELFGMLVNPLTIYILY